jgi:hypothetical protein
VVARGEVVAERPPAPVAVHWLGAEHEVDFVRDADAGSAGWRDASIDRTGAAR